MATTSPIGNKRRGLAGLTRALPSSKLRADFVAFVDVLEVEEGLDIVAVGDAVLDQKSVV